MLEEKLRYRVILFLALTGLLVSLLSLLAEFFPWLQSFCAGFSNGCRETEKITLLRLPLWGWGVAYYLLLTVSAWRFKGWLLWWIPAGAGVEVTLLWFMYAMKAPCVFCLGNFMVILLLLLFSVPGLRFWSAASMLQFLFIASFFVMSHENQGVLSEDVKAGVQSDVVAKIGDEIITRQRLEAPLYARISPYEREVYRLKRERLDGLIREMLLEKESKERGISTEKYIDEVILKKGTQVSEEETDRYLRENQERLKNWRGSQDELRERVRAYLEQEKKLQEINQYVKALEPKYGVTVFLGEPKPPLMQVQVEGSPVLGPEDAPVTVVEFSDYQCPACRHSHGVVRRIREAYAGKLRWFFKDLPLKMHKDAKKAAEAARCAAEQNKFWEYQDVLYSTQEGLSQEQLKNYAQDMGLDTGRFNQCLESGKFGAAIEKEVQEARTVGIDSTPTFVINGKMAAGGPTFEQFKEIIEEELKQSEGKS